MYIVCGNHDIDRINPNAVTYENRALKSLTHLIFYRYIIIGILYSIGIIIIPII